VSAVAKPLGWMFHIGIHRGTLTSRDAEPPKEIESLEKCQRLAHDSEREYASFGCKIWYCYAVSPEGQRHTLIEGEPYQ
jgi:hypothetical protein